MKITRFIYGDYQCAAATHPVEIVDVQGDAILALPAPIDTHDQLRNAVRAYEIGVERGRRAGEADAKAALRKALGILDGFDHAERLDSRHVRRRSR